MKYPPFAYALLPISIIESGWNAHFEPLANLLMLISLLLFLRKKHPASGAALGLGAATKVYPGLLFPIFLFQIKGWRNRIEYTVAAIVSALLTIIPFTLISFVTIPPDPTGETGNYNLFISLLDFIVNPSFPSIILSLSLLGIMVFIVIMVSFHLTNIK